MESDSEEVRSTPRKRGELIAVCSAKGGVGRTVTAVNLAVALSKNNNQIGVIDANYQFGDVCLALDLTPTFTMKDVVEGFEMLDAFALSSYLNRHSTGVRVLASPDRPEFADLITAPIQDKICDYMTALHDFVIVDTGAGLQESTLQYMEKADQILVITTLEMTSVKNTKLMLETLDLLGLHSKIHVVINRSTMDSVIQASDVPDILGEEAPAYIPNNFQAVSQSLNLGIPYVMSQGKTDLAKAVFKMAEQLVSRREITVFKPKSQSLLQSLFHKPKPT